MSRDVLTHMQVCTHRQIQWVLSLALAAATSGCSGGVSPLIPEPSPPPAQSSAACAPADAEAGVWGFVTEPRLPHPPRPIGSATVELYSGSPFDPRFPLGANPIATTTTSEAGRFQMCLPPNSPSGPGGAAFALRVSRAEQ
jgi:hypothetical protein